ncbi:hypothetical protein DPMN_116797 [Dreissena polymorpha]|uniref:Uncharacterized protein n=1 Tax=Dreissena polymorpha TaxID=45954 RepID=A0A9D4QTV5_DREPO|nr:hypothetical protein DPMN_116797 [Dreissena polymorpha]
MHMHRAAIRRERERHFRRQQGDLHVPYRLFNQRGQHPDVQQYRKWLERHRSHVHHVCHTSVSDWWIRFDDLRRIKH